MRIKALCITMLIFTVLIFGGNHYAARTELPQADCCGACIVQLAIKISGREEPSCSLKFRGPPEPSKPVEEGEETLAPLPGKMETERLTTEPIRLPCRSRVLCDRLAAATIDCIDGATIIIDPGKTCDTTCENGIMVTRCRHWARKRRPQSAPTRRRSPLESSSLFSQFLDATLTVTSITSRLVPAKYSGATEDAEAREFLSGSNRWRLIEGEAGLEQGALFIPSGEAAVQTFCTGDTLRAAGPSVITLPVCEVDVSGRWRGAYVRRLAAGSLRSVAIALNLRKESGSLGGELTTADGTFNIVEASQSGSDIWLRAERKVAGTTGKIELSGTFTKGDIAFDGSEQSADGKTTYGLTGDVRRLYVADSGLPIAVLNQPYGFKLTTLPNRKAISFRLANPAAKQPEQITWATEAESLRGRNGERFTYLCPANGSLNRLYSRDNAYTDTSSICTAAVKADLITQQAGGVVTIKIQPGPSPDTGRFVFVSNEPQTAVSGRLPRGLSFDTRSGTFSGTPTELGNFELSIVVDDGAGNVFEQPLTLTVKKLAVTNALLPDAFIGQPYAATLKVVGGRPPYRFSGEVPPGLQLDPNTGALRGRPSSRGDKSSFAVTVRDGQNNSETQNVRLRVRGTTIMNSYFLPDAEVGVPYRTQFQAVGSPTSLSWEFVQEDASAIGLSLSGSTGELSGTPTKAGNLQIEVRAKGQSGTSTRRFALTIKPRSGTGLRGTF